MISVITASRFCRMVKWRHDAEDRAWRRTFVAGVLGLCLGYVVTAAIAGIVALPLAGVILR